MNAIRFSFGKGMIASPSKRSEAEDLTLVNVDTMDLTAIFFVRMGSLKVEKIATGPALSSKAENTTSAICS